MKKDLTPEEIEEMLYRQYYGHLGFISKKRQYILPITYAYDGTDVYSFSFEGKKTEAMRIHPRVCMQIEDIDSENEEWKSALVWGNFEELSGKDAERGMSLLLEKLYSEGVRKQNVFMPFRHSLEAMEAAIDEKEAVVYKIVLTEKIGRMEQYDV